MRIFLFQIVLSGFAFLGFVDLCRRSRRGEIGRLSFISFSLIFLLIFLVAFLPEITSRLAIFFGIGRGSDLAVYAAISVLIYAVFRQYSEIEKQRREITVLTREISILKGEKEYK